jgi:mannose-6-phosphate isomerase-like protein (cupin superfamily)
MKHTQLGNLPKSATGAPAFAGVKFQTPWDTLNYLELPPGASFSPPPDAPFEQGYIVLDGPVKYAGDGPTQQLRGPAVLLCQANTHHTLTNSGGQPARLLHMRVALDPPPDKKRALLREDVDVDQLKWRDAIHGGAGRIATRHIWGPDDFSSTWTFLDHAVLGSQSSVGYHYHDALEECFLILRGRGYMTIADETFEVGPGSATWQGIRAGHGIYNPHDDELDFLRLAVAQKDETYTTVDLHDSLAARRP